MIRDSALSKQKLGEFFINSPNFTELEVPELTRFSTSTINNLIINNPVLKKINFPALEQQPGILIGENLREVNLPVLPYITNFADVISGGILTSRFLQNTKLQTLELPELQGTLNEETDLNSAVQMGFARNYWLKEVSLGNAYLTNPGTASFGRFWFYYNYSLQKLILRYPYILPLTNVTGLATTPIAYGKGFIFVPDNLIDDYKTSGSWANFAAQFRPITQLNDLSYEDTSKLEYDTITDSWETIINKCNNDSLTGEYTIGATKTVEIDGMPTQMVIVGIKKDDLSDGTGKASISWMEKHISRYNTIVTAVNNGSIRNYRNMVNFHQSEKEKIFNGLPEVVQNGIKEVKKKSYGWVDTDGRDTIETNEKIWLPSAMELGLQQSAGIQLESDTPYFYFSDHPDSATNRVFYFGYTKRTPLAGTNQVALRTFTSQSNYSDTIDNNGRFVSGLNSQFPQYLIIGFCT